MHPEDVVVGREEVHGLGRGRRRLDLDGDLSIIDATEVTAAAGLKFLRTERKRIRIHARHRGASVVRVRLHLVEVLTTLRFHSVLTVKNKFEFLERTNRARRRDGTVFRHAGGRVAVTDRNKRRASGVGDRHEGVGVSTSSQDVRFEDNGIFIQVGGEVPQGRVRDGAIVETEDQFLHRVVEGKSNLLGVTGFDGVSASVLHLFNEVFVRLLGESASFVRVQEMIIGPTFESGAIGVVGELGAQIHIDTCFVILKRNKREGKTRMAVKPEDEREVDGTVFGVGGHLRPVSLLGFRVVQVIVQTPPLLEVTINALSTNGHLDVLDGTFRGVDGGSTLGGGAEARLSLHFEVHVLDQITVAGDRDRNATVVSGSTVNGLLDDFRSEVGIAFVVSGKKSYLRVRCQVQILGSIGHELHKTASHVVRVFCTIGTENNFRLVMRQKTHHLFSCYTIMATQDEKTQTLPVEEEEYSTEEEEELEEGELIIDDDDDDVLDMMGGIDELLTTVLSTPDGDTVCSALVHIGNQLEMQNKILIKILSKLT